ncbi:hypothetical protein B0A55_04650 [Friedmanniomyces simplex]|uniref:Uncharacterized protein n=1 Tax=Friedmanniomyces simplex TaxID=329884 RepID=A0A4U0XEZ8_9PEZI|nr:hypothetical protein B0A55_04650 [Friedmanniomyces simplex]
MHGDFSGRNNRFPYGGGYATATPGYGSASRYATEQTGGAEQGGESGDFDFNAFMDFELQTSLIMSGMVPNAMHGTVTDHRPSNMAAQKSLQHFFTPAVGQATQEAAGHPEVKPDYAAAYNGIFLDEASCDAYWSSTQGVGYTPLSIEDDDVDDVSDGEKGNLIQAMFNAITDDPGPAPSGATYTKLGAGGYKRAYAGCAKLYYRAVRLHQEGIPTQLLKKKAATTTTGYSVDLNSKSTQRMANIIDAVSSNKRVACDVLKAERLDDLVRSPKAFVDRKLHNCKGNGQKGRDLQEIKVYRTRGQATVQAPWQGPFPSGWMPQSSGFRTSASAVGADAGRMVREVQTGGQLQAVKTPQGGTQTLPSQHIINTPTAAFFNYSMHPDSESTGSRATSRPYELYSARNYSGKRKRGEDTDNTGDRATMQMRRTSASDDEGGHDEGGHDEDETFTESEYGAYFAPFLV